jgi:hypothetical protein
MMPATGTKRFNKRTGDAVTIFTGGLLDADKKTKYA